MYSRILVAVDASESSARALREAIALACDQQAALRVLHVVDMCLYGAYTSAVSGARWRRALFDEGQQMLNEAADAADLGGVEAETVLHENETGTVSRAILDEAARWPADLVVMGTHGRSGIAHLLLGSVAEGVMRRAAVPVLLTRGC